MKRRSLFWILTMVFILLSIIVFTSTVFSVKKVEIKFLSQKLLLPDKYEDEILKNVNIAGNIFFVNKENIKFTIQTANPLVKVINIESIFPDKLKINVAERKKFYSVRCTDGYYICDEMLGTIEKIKAFSSTQINPIIIEGLTFSNPRTGMEISPTNCNADYISDISYSLLEWKNDVYTLQSYISSIIIDYIKKDQIMISMFNGVSIMVEKASENTSLKLNYAFSYFSAYNISIGTIKIICSSDNKTLLIYDRFNNN